MKNCLFHCAPPDLFPLAYLEAVESFADVRLLSIGPMMAAGPWADKMKLLTGELARHDCQACGSQGPCEHWNEREEKTHLNIVCAPMGMQLGMTRSLADYAPDDAQTNPALAAQNPDLVQAGEQARAKKHLAAYSPSTAFQALFFPAHVNVAVLKPIRAKRSQLSVDLTALEQYDLVVAPVECVHLFRQLGVDAIGSDPSDFASDILSTEEIVSRL